MVTGGCGHDFHATRHRRNDGHDTIPGVRTKRVMLLSESLRLLIAGFVFVFSISRRTAGLYMFCCLSAVQHSLTLHRGAPSPPTCVRKSMYAVQLMLWSTVIIRNIHTIQYIIYIYITHRPFLWHPVVVVVVVIVRRLLTFSYVVARCFLKRIRRCV